MSSLTLTIPELPDKDIKNYSWFNNYIAAILYSQYSRELIYKNEWISWYEWLGTKKVIIS